MRDLSRIFQGILACPLSVIQSEEILVKLWKHENHRVFQDKLTRVIDKDVVEEIVNESCLKHFGEALNDKTSEMTLYDIHIRSAIT